MVHPLIPFIAVSLPPNEILCLRGFAFAFTAGWQGALSNDLFNFI